MTAWSDKITEGFQPEFARLWVVLDPDELMLTAPVTVTLRERGFEIVPLRDPLAFRLEYETRVRGSSSAAPTIVHLNSGDERKVPWDVLKSARVGKFSVAELFPTLDPNAVRAVGPERFDRLYEAVQRQGVTKPLAVNASREFITSAVYGVVPSLITTPAEFWVARFDLFFRGDDLPVALAAHLAASTPLPEAMTHEDATAILSSRSAFLERVQRDWDSFARAASSGGEPAADVIPFSFPRIRISMDSMILDAAVKPVEIDTPTTDLPSWMQIGIVDNGNAGRRLLEKQIERLGIDIPGEEDDYHSWLGFGMRQAEVIASFYEAPPATAEHLRANLQNVLVEADRAFFRWIERDFGNLASNSVVKAPTLVHQIPHHMAHRRHAGELRQALIVVDGLALDQWVILERDLKGRRDDILIETSTCFAWLPTVTSVSRQSIFAGSLPRTFVSTIGTTSAEPAAWSRFWAEEGIAQSDVCYTKSIGLPGTVASVLQQHVEPHRAVIGLVVDTVDQMMHGMVLGKAGMITNIRHWLVNGEWHRLIDGLISAGYTIFVTADHGNVEARGVGRPNEGVLPEAKGERVRIYGSEALRDNALATISGARTLKLGGLPADHLPVFPPSGAAFLPKGTTGVVHGGTSIEEVIVPFVRITRKEK